MSGAYTSLDELTRLAGPARHIPLYKPGQARAQLTGGHQSRLRGRGMDFEEFRNYQPGDDIRTIDWRVSARTGKTQTRVYREERERPVLLVLDQGSGLFFGSQMNFKSVTAAETMALLAWRTLQHGDRVGALLAGQHEHMEFRPRRSRQHVLQLLQKTVTLNQELQAGQSRNDQALDKMLARTVRLAHPGSLVVVISDFHGISDSGLRDMALVSRHSDLMAVQVFDPMDQELPPAGIYAVSDGQSRGLLDSRSHKTRNSYQQQARERQDRLVNHLNRYNIPLHRLNTCQATETQLLQSTRHKTNDFSGELL